MRAGTRSPSSPRRSSSQQPSSSCHASRQSISPAFSPRARRGPISRSEIVTGLAAGLFEELGWTGFATPQLRRRYSVVATCIILGLAWGLWHLLVVWWGSSATSGGLSMALYLPVMLFSFLVPYRVLMTWVYDRTGSLLVGMLMHAALTASVRIFDPLAISGVPILIYNLSRLTLSNGLKASIAASA